MFKELADVAAVLLDSNVVGLWESVAVVLLLLSEKACACDCPDTSTEKSDLTFLGAGCSVS